MCMNVSHKKDEFMFYIKICGNIFCLSFKPMKVLSDILMVADDILDHQPERTLK